MHLLCVPALTLLIVFVSALYVYSPLVVTLLGVILIPTLSGNQPLSFPPPVFNMFVHPAQISSLRMISNVLQQLKLLFDIRYDLI